MSLKANFMLYSISFYNYNISVFNRPASLFKNNNFSSRTKLSLTKKLIFKSPTSFLSAKSYYKNPLRLNKSLN